MSVTADCKLDTSFHSHLSVLEDWAVENRDLGLPSKTRMSWMSPSYVSSTGRYIFTSQLFQDRGAYNAKGDVPFKVDYEVHPWIREFTVPNNGDWIPNPDLVQVFDGQHGKLDLLKDSDNPVLNAGDLIKILFNVVFTVYSKRWLMALNPVQMIRVIESHATSGNIPTEDTSRDSSRLLKAGSILKPFSFEDKSTEEEDDDEELIPWDLTPEPEDRDREHGSDIPEPGREGEQESGGTLKRKADEEPLASTDEGNQGGETKRRHEDSPDRKRRSQKSKRIS